MDSAVAAALLKTQGFDVVALHMRFWEKSVARKIPAGGSCCRWVESEKVEKLCASLEIPLQIVDVSEEYAAGVLDYVVHDYLMSRLPNPCVLCNSVVKFETLIRKADELRCDLVATGHYAKVVHSAENEKEGEAYIYKAVDRARDQSYFLFTLKQQQLARTIMPLGDLLESNIIKMAHTFGVPLAPARNPGQPICFVDTSGVREVIASRAPERYRPSGPIVNREGQTLGRHDGLHLYRIGQTRVPGVDTPEGVNLFVVGIDSHLNALILGEQKDLYQQGLVATDCNWIGVQDFSLGLHAKARIRAHHTEEAACHVTLLNNNSVLVEFEKPQIGVMPGQAVVFYQDDVLIGGGWIDSSTSPATTRLSKRQAFIVKEDPYAKKKI